MDSPVDLGFGVHLRQLRRRAGLSQDALAERAGLSAAAVSAIERGVRQSPYPDTLSKLATALDLPLEQRAEFYEAAGRAPSREPPGATSRVARRVNPVPVPPGPFVGREPEVARVLQLLGSPGVRLMTLSGPGGVGKTRLAIEVGRRLADRGWIVVWVDLSATRDAAEIPGAILASSGLRPDPTREPLSALHDYLEGQPRLLLVVDNFEQVLDGADDLSSLLGRHPLLQVLVTSRSTLRLRAEHELPVLPLALPQPSGAVTARSVRESEAGAFFLDRCGALAPRFQLGDENARAAADLCAHLDGLPLALELAAAQLRYRSLAELLAARDPGDAGFVDAPARHRSLEAMLDSSLELLDEGQRRLFRRLSVFAASFTKQLARDTCCDAEPGADFEADFDRLVDQNLVQAATTTAGPLRFRLLVTVRRYAEVLLDRAGETLALDERHGRAFAALLEAADENATSAGREAWFRQLDASRPDITGAINWAFRQSDHAIAVRMVGTLGPYWASRGASSEDLAWVEKALLISPGCPLSARARLLYVAACAEWWRHRLASAAAFAEESVGLWREVGDARRLAVALAMLGLISISANRLPEALRAHQECLELFEELRSGWGVGYALANLGDTQFEMGEVDEARRSHLRSLDHFAEAGDPWGQGVVLHWLGREAWEDSDAATAYRRFAAAVANFRSIENFREVARALIGMAAASLELGRGRQAGRLLLESAQHWRDVGDLSGVALCLGGLGAVLVQRGQLRQAARLFRAERVAASTYARPYALDPNLFRVYRERVVAALGRGAIEVDAPGGGALSLSDALAEFRRRP